MENEIWKNIENYPDYQISNMGNIKSLNYNRTGKERILKQVINEYGYCYVRLCKEGKPKHYYVHRLVSIAFLPNPQNLPCVNHIDETKTNNCVSNLEWCSYQYNNRYGTKNERISKANSKPILQFNREGTKILGKFNSAKQAGKELNINNTHICECCNGNRKSAGKYRWMYLQDYVNRMEKLYQLTLKKAS